jgi:hypothetical protein
VIQKKKCVSDRSGLNSSSTRFEFVTEVILWVVNRNFFDSLSTIKLIGRVLHNLRSENDQENRQLFHVVIGGKESKRREERKKKKRGKEEKVERKGGKERRKGGKGKGKKERENKLK